MIRAIINGHVLKLYDSIEDMPIVNFQKYNKYLLIDTGVGSNLDDYNNHILKLYKYAANNDMKSLVRELDNTRQLMFMINQEISPKYLAFAALICEFDGKRVTDLSDDNLKSILKQIQTVKHNTIIQLLAKIKKKVNTELNTYFPSMFGSAKEKEAYDKLRQRTLVELDSIINDTDETSKLEAIDNEILSLYKPKSFTGSNSAEVQYDKSFENTCLSLQFKLQIPNAKRLTVLEYYNAVDELNKLIKAETKGNKKR